MPRKTTESKGPIGEDPPILTGEADLAQLIAAQAKTTELLGQLGAMVVAASAQGEGLTRRVDGMERAMLGLVEVLRQMYAVLQDALAMRRF